MTTNYPQMLDSALSRPGRIDQQVKFTLATNDQIKDIYERMYEADDYLQRKVGNVVGNDAATPAKLGKIANPTHGRVEWY
jgi:chaperone BCS1